MIRVYMITTENDIFYVASSSVMYAVAQAEQHITDTTTTGVAPRRITEIKRLGQFVDPDMNVRGEE